jgi:protoheme IX farnesyltransferase
MSKVSKRPTSTLEKATIATYYRLAKPGIVYGNVLTTVAAFAFARGYTHAHALQLFLATSVGISLVIGSACVFNNYLDRDIDRRMPRTKHRALATGIISVQRAWLYGAVLGISGFALLLGLVNMLTACMALLGFISYVAWYTPAKHSTYYAALIGTLPGAVPMVVGYTAVVGHLDFVAVVLFLGMVVWQIPHFFAIAIFRMEDYRAANIPVYSLVKGVQKTKSMIVVSIALFLFTTLALALVARPGFIYLACMVLVSGFWFGIAYRGLSTHEDALWAKRVFRLSLITLLVWCGLLAASPFLP